MDSRIQIGISTCPNDTFAFHAMMNRAVDWRGLEFNFRLLDVQQLNECLMNGEFDVAKASFHAALLLSDETVVLPSGSALGFGVGPLLLSRHADCTPKQLATILASHKQLDDQIKRPVVLCPGETTTATLLYQMFFADSAEVDLQQVVFSEIMPALQNGDADFGVCIHEGRFTWQESDLHCVADLGELWEQETKVGLPLGGILGRKKLGVELLNTIQSVIRDSIEYGLANRIETLPTMRKYATEFSDDVLFSHVDLYVNQQTVELGEVGREALSALSNLAIASMPERVKKPLQVLAAS